MQIFNTALESFHFCLFLFFIFFKRCRQRRLPTRLQHLLHANNVYRGPLTKRFKMDLKQALWDISIPTEAPRQRRLLPAAQQMPRVFRRGITSVYPKNKGRLINPSIVSGGAGDEVCVCVCVGRFLIVKKGNHFLPINPHNRSQHRRRGWQIIMRPQISIDEAAEAFFNKQSVDKLDWQQIQSAQRQSKRERERDGRAVC